MAMRYGANIGPFLVRGQMHGDFGRGWQVAFQLAALFINFNDIRRLQKSLAQSRWGDQDFIFAQDGG